MDAERPELPPGVTLLWGRRGPDRRGRALMSDAALEGASELASAGWRERLTSCAPAQPRVVRPRPGRPCRHRPARGREGPRRHRPHARRARPARRSIDLAAGYEADPEAFGAGFARALATVVDPARYPALSRVIASGVFGPGGPGGEDTPPEGYDDFGPEFAFALSCYLDGVAAFIERGIARR